MAKYLLARHALWFKNHVYVRRVNDRMEGAFYAYHPSVLHLNHNMWYYPALTGDVGYFTRELTIAQYEMITVCKGKLLRELKAMGFVIDHAPKEN